MSGVDDVDSLLIETVNGFLPVPDEPHAPRVFRLKQSKYNELLLELQHQQDEAVAEATREANLEIAELRRLRAQQTDTNGLIGRQLVDTKKLYEDALGLCHEQQDELDRLRRSKVVRILSSVLRHKPVKMHPDRRADFDIAKRVLAERERQDLKWGANRHQPDGTGSLEFQLQCDTARHETDRAFAEGRGTWAHILLEEVYEALAENNLRRLKEELIQVAAVCLAWYLDVATRPMPKPRTRQRRD